MNKELAKTLTTALVQFIDREQPKDKMCVSSIEAEELERCFTEEKFNRVEDWCAYRMLPELTEFEKCMLDFAKARDEYEFDSTKVVELNNKVIELTKSYANKLLELAKKELARRDEVITLNNLPPYDKGFQDGKAEAMADLERTFECNPDKLPIWLKNELTKRHLEGYCTGRGEALREMSDFVESHFNPKKAREGEDLTDLYYKEYERNPEPIPTGVAYNPSQCGTNVTMVPNINSGTSTLKAEG